MIAINRIIDIDKLLEWRQEVIGHVFGEAPSDELMEANRNYYIRHIADGSHLAFVANSDGETVGCGAICMTEELPSPDNPTGRCAYIMNIYVREAYRRHGVGEKIIRHLIAKAKSLDPERYTSKPQAWLIRYIRRSGSLIWKI